MHALELCTNYVVQVHVSIQYCTGTDRGFVQREGFVITGYPVHVHVLYCIACVQHMRGEGPS